MPPSLLAKQREPFPYEIDLNRIFIPREEQLDLFRQYLYNWKQQMLVTDNSPLETAPPLENKIQGLVVLLYGHSGFGKTTLLKHLHQEALAPQYNLKVSKLINWDSIATEGGALFKPAPGQDIDIFEYFKLLHVQLASVLEKRLYEFKKYKEAVKAVEEARKQANKVITTLQTDNRFAALRWVTGEGAVKLIQLISPRVSSAVGLNNEKVAEKVKEYVGQGAEISVEHLLHLYSRLKEALNTKLEDYLEPALRLGLALGRDLRQFAKNFPLLLFFDTYEKVNEGDKLLRIVMEAAGVRVGWVIAGQSNLLEASQLSTELEYGYRDIVLADRLLPIHFTNEAGKDFATQVRAFSSAEIVSYFAQVRKQKPSLPALRKPNAERIWQMTQGVPLAVRIAADLYTKNPDLQIITGVVEDVNDIVGKMVQRYLRYAPDDPGERAKLYGLAILRRSSEPQAVTAGLGLSPEQEIDYERVLNQLQRRYSFIFTERGQPVLQPEVRYFLRLWLIERCKEPDKASVITRLKQIQWARLETLEKRPAYRGLRDRLEDDEWVEVYLDLLEAQYWDNIFEGIQASLSFMLAAAVYRRSANTEVFSLGEFFKEHMQNPYRDWWRWATQSLRYPTNRLATESMREGLEEIHRLISQDRLTFAEPLAAYKDELEATLWWRLGEAYYDRDEEIALTWYKKALERLPQHIELQDDAARLCTIIANRPYDRESYTESISFLDEAIKIKYDYADAYYNRGNAYYKLKEFQRAVVDYRYTLELNIGHAHAYENLGNAHMALQEYQDAIANYTKAMILDPNNADLYYNRANAHAALRNSQKALEDFQRAIDLKPEFAWAIMNRGNIYALLKEREKALIDYKHAVELAPTDINIVWTAIWANFNKQPIGAEMALRLEEIASLDPHHYIAYICRGIVKGLRRENLNVSLREIEQAIELEPGEWDSYFWKGMTCAYLGRKQEAIEAIEKSLDLGLPLLLLTPLYWLESTRPSFFREYARSLLERYQL